MSKNERSPQKALLLSMLMPGVGQVYNGEVSKGIAIFLAISSSVHVFSWLAVKGPAIALWVLVLAGGICGLSIAIASYFDAFKRAKQIGHNYELGPYNKAYVYFSMIVVANFFIGSQISHVREHLVELYRVPSVSMSPGLEKGDFFFADKDVNAPDTKRGIKRGDIAIFVYPNDRTSTYVKRVIGLPGDKVELRGTEVLVNGQSISAAEPVSHFSKAGNLVRGERSDSGKIYDVYWHPDSQGSRLLIDVPNGQVFVLGDNRDEAFDSRKFGTVPLSDVIGVAKQVLFSLADGPSRMGKRVDVN